ncbi:hypothetical protein LSH36_107g11050 [Paralvinella palmiformis]|uniref:Uncharacterized protein n=1 Tax=Paralvinella palmiformis TaxID=53620 RepID=A0AAD9K137_9ANNE|nr:hypothetical protein LSH36_107g11050 [Paralvinella palmiformis]
MGCDRCKCGKCRCDCPDCRRCIQCCRSKDRRRPANKLPLLMLALLGGPLGPKESYDTTLPPPPCHVFNMAAVCEPIYGGYRKKIFLASPKFNIQTRPKMGCDRCKCGKCRCDCPDCRRCIQCCRSKDRRRPANKLPLLMLALLGGPLGPKGKNGTKNTGSITQSLRLRDV